jgi:hypothetical protein
MSLNDTRHRHTLGTARDDRINYRTEKPYQSLRVFVEFTGTWNPASSPAPVGTARVWRIVKFFLPSGA